MKNKTVFFLVCLIINIALVSCKGKTGERIIKAAEDAAEHYHPKPKPSTIDHVKDAYDYVTNDDEEETYVTNDDAEETVVEEPQYQPQAVWVVCTQCGGYGAVPMRDGYGNIVTDYYGNPMPAPCAVCGGTGQQIVYQ